MIHFDRITDNLYVGTCPTSVIDIRQLGTMGISAVVNLQSDRDFARLRINWPDLARHYTDQHIEACRFPMADFDEADIERRLVDAAGVVNRVMEAGHCVYLHCTAGCERSPTTAAAWLTLYGKMAPEKALLHVIDARKSRPYIEMVQRLAPA